VRLTAHKVLASSGLGEFSLTAEQQSVKAIFVPLVRLQKELNRTGQVNTVLVADASSGTDGSSDMAVEASLAQLEGIVRSAATLEDMGISLRRLRIPGEAPDNTASEWLSLEKASTLLDESLVAKAQSAAAATGMASMPVLTYLANRIRIGGHETPYSLVAALDSDIFRRFTFHSSNKDTMPPIWLNQWAAEDLKARIGDPVMLEYYLWTDEGQLATETSEFQLAGILPIRGIAADRNLAPEYPGISDSDTLTDWDPPFPMDLGLIRPKDEAYWKEYRATPKAFITLADGQRLWRSRFGVLTSMRFTPAPSAISAAEFSPSAAEFRERLQTSLSPFETGFAMVPVKAQGLAASQGATDFGEYFTYFSFFLVVSALLLASLFFRLGLEQRLREVGLLRALGFAPHQVRNLFLQEGLVLAVLGSLVGACGAVAYGYLMMLFLRTWWIGAVGTTALALYVSPGSLLAGVTGGILSAAGCVAVTLRSLMRASPRGLLTGGGVSATIPVAKSGSWKLRRATAFAFLLLGGMLLAATGTALISEAGGFFGAGISFLVSLLCLQSILLQRTPPQVLTAAGISTVWKLGFRQASDRPGRSILCIALIASATFIIAAVEAFRRDSIVPLQPSFNQQPASPSGTGRYALMGQSLLPIFVNWNTPEGRQALGFSEQNSKLWNQSTVVRFRVRPGEDTSCLNLFQPKKPRLLAPERGHSLEGRFAFKETIAANEPEKRNPWRLLDRAFQDGAVPVIGDANSLAYVMHLKVGDDWALQRNGREEVKLRVVAALDDSLFQREFLISEENFKRLFPELQGYSFFLFDVPMAQAAEWSQLLENRLADEGLDVSRTDERLASFHRVENTYLSTFQFLGGLGLLLGTLGLAVVLLRNVLERRRELAVLRAVGYKPRQLATIVLAENGFLLFRGAATGIVCAMLAILPAIASRGWKLTPGSLGWLLLAVVLAGLAASLLATRAALRSPLLAALRSE